jgi:predicted esterase
VRLAVFVLLSVLGGPLAAQLVENVAARSDPSQTYTLFLPKLYDGRQPHPVLLVFDPRGRGTTAAEVFRDAAEEYGWIVISSNQTRSDGAHEPNERAIRALLPELGRYAVNAERVYAAGFSGTAMMAWGVGIATGRLAGVIGVGGRFVPEVPPSKFNFAHYGFAGERDFNHREMRLVDDALEGRVPHRFQPFDGEHQWIPPALAREALGWFEVLAGSHVEQVFAEDLSAADRLTGLEALRRYRAILRTYENVGRASARSSGGRAEARPALRTVLEKVAALERDPSVLREIAEEKKWDTFEVEYANGVFARMPAVLASGDLARAFRLPDLRRRAARGGAEGAAARRLLEAVYGQTAFYLMQQLFARGEYARAAALLGIAVEIHPERWGAWYNLAAAHARAGNRRQAFAALEKAIAAGFRDAKQLADDDDFTSLRGEKRFQDLLASASQ